ncbi:MAG: NAD(P)H-dependent oxidoreductase subunit E [Dehalococcoidales bacterium]|jgi:NADH-quinone oxidoreductase subunit E
MNNRRDILGQFTSDRKNLLPILYRVQAGEGYLSPGAVAEISRFLDLSENDVFSTASFYPDLRFTPHPAHTVRVCTCLECRLRGAEDIISTIEQALNTPAGPTAVGATFRLDKASFPGCASLAPVVVVDEDVYCRVTPDVIEEILAKYR